MSSLVDQIMHRVDETTFVRVKNRWPGFESATSESLTSGCAHDDQVL